MGTSYQYQPISGPLYGTEFELQTMRFLADAASRADWGNVKGRPDIESLMAGVNQQLTSLDGRTSATEQALATTQSSVAVNTQLIRELQQKEAFARADIEALKARADATDTASLALQERVGKAESHILAAQTSLAALQTQADTTDASLSVSQADIETLQTRADTHEQSLQGAHADIARAAQAAVMAQGSADAAQSTADTAQNAAAAAQGSADNAQNTADAAQGTADAVQASVNTLLPLVLTPGIIALCNGEAPAGWVLCDGTHGTPNLGGYATAPLRYIQFSGQSATPSEPAQQV